MTTEYTCLASGAKPLSFTGLDLSAIHPDRGAKYSPNLYSFLTGSRHRSLATRARVFADKQNVLWLGYFGTDGLLVGARLSRVLVDGAKAMTSCPINLGPLNEVTDFWANYIRDGRCAIDTAHAVAYLNDETRWAVKGNTRSCLWCKKTTQKLLTRLVTTEHKSWTTQ